MRNRYKMIVLAGVAAMGLALSVPAHAVVLNYFATLNGASEVPPNGSPATGTGTFIIDTDANTIDYNVSFTVGLLLGPQTAAHIHCCAPPGSNAGIIIPLPLGSPAIGQGTYVEANEASIIASLSYVNVHTTVFPGGEIRGQIIPQATATEETTWGLIKALYH